MSSLLTRLCYFYTNRLVQSRVLNWSSPEVLLSFSQQTWPWRRDLTTTSTTPLDTRGVLLGPSTAQPAQPLSTLMTRTCARLQKLTNGECRSYTHTHIHIPTKASLAVPAPFTPIAHRHFPHPNIPFGNHVGKSVRKPSMLGTERDTERERESVRTALAERLY